MSTHRQATADSPATPAMVSVEQALELMLARARPVTDSETVSLGAALGRVLAHAESSPIDVPGFANSSMDGYAIRASDAPCAIYR